MSDKARRLLSFVRLPTQPLLRHLLLAGIAGVVLFLFTTTLSEYDNLQVATIATYAIAIAGVSVLTGVSGQISIGNGAFMAVGAYAAGLVMEHAHLPL
ncbi:MAG: branched-chain amino acid ABC transporter permease, partial [Acidimicrobiales bacterium]